MLFKCTNRAYPWTVVIDRFRTGHWLLLLTPPASSVVADNGARLIGCIEERDGRILQSSRAHHHPMPMHILWGPDPQTANWRIITIYLPRFSDKRRETLTRPLGRDCTRLFGTLDTKADNGGVINTVKLQQLHECWGSHWPQCRLIQNVFTSWATEMAAFRYRAT